MIQSRLFLLLLCLLTCAVLQAAPDVTSPSHPAANAPVVGAEEQTYFGPREEPPLRLPGHSLDDPIGALYQAGTTWYDYQHNGSAGKMISVDNDGYVHLVWMKGTTSVPTGDRRIYYNVWDPTSLSMVFQSGGQPSGVQVDAQLRAGYTSQALLPDGWCFPAYHQGRNGVTGIHAGVGMDFEPRTGQFTTTEPNYLNEGGTPLQLVWPKAAIGRDSVLHMATAESPYVSGTIPMRVYYSRGTPAWDDHGDGLQVTWQNVTPDNQQFMFVDSTTTVAHDIAASRISDRVAMVWARFRISNSDQFNNDIMMMVSEDGGLNWGPHINITSFAAADTFRAYTDASVMFDDNDVIHVAFTTGQYTEGVGAMNSQESAVWHWDEFHQQFSPVAVVWYSGSTGSVGVWQRIVQRPSLSQDPVTDYLYCSYQKYDTSAYSSAGYYNADAYVSVSTDDGVHWSVGRNVTGTRPTIIPAPVGQSLHERDITLADRVTYAHDVGYLNLEYILDLDAGGISQGEGTATNNPVYYQRIPADSIPRTPVMPFYALHIGGTPPAPTAVTAYPVATGIRLMWRGAFMPYYKIYSSPTYAGSYGTLEGTTSDTTFTDVSAPATSTKFYIVRSSTAP